MFPPRVGAAGVVAPVAGFAPPKREPLNRLLEGAAAVVVPVVPDAAGAAAAAVVP